MMERYYGFDLGDAESAVACAGKEASEEPKILPVSGALSFITAYARMADGKLLIGESACYSPDAAVRKLRFKSRFLTDKESEKDVRTFAAGVLGELIGDGYVVKGQDSCFYVGCPAGWKEADRERYREIFEQVGYPPVRIVSESRAALISACRSKHLQVGYDILSRPVLVVDAGSSTTDFAFIESGKEVELQTAGEVLLGGGIMDRMLLDLSVEADAGRSRLHAFLEAHAPWKSYCEFAARRLKERYFADEDYWASRSLTRSIELPDREPLTLTLRMDRAMADRLLNAPAKELDGKTFRSAFCSSLQELREKISLPELIFLTGGVSNLPAIADWCRKAFPESVVIKTPQPEFSVARGLSGCGRIDEETRAFRREVEALIESSTAERIVSGRMEDLYRAVADAIAEPIMNTVVMNVFEEWRSGQIARLSQIDEVLEKEITAWLRGEEAQKILVRTVSSWLKPVAFELEEYTMPICVRHNIPYRAMNLNSYLNASDIDLHIDAKDIFAVDQITWLINAIISVLVGLLCGGGGIALISSGLEGILAGTILSLMVLLIGQGKMEQGMMELNIPKPLRKLVSHSAFESRIRKLTPQVRDGLYESLEKEKDQEITERLVAEISGQIEQCLMRMAQVVEIPLG